MNPHCLKQLQSIQINETVSLETDFNEWIKGDIRHDPCTTETMLSWKNNPKHISLQKLKVLIRM